jgi:hypothetical protein
MSIFSRLTIPYAQWMIKIAWNGDSSQHASPPEPIDYIGMISGESDSVDSHGPRAMDVTDRVCNMVLIARVAPSSRIVNP